MLYVPNRIYDQIAFLFGFGIEILAYRIESFGCIRSRIGRRRLWGRFRGRFFGRLLRGLASLAIKALLPK